MKTENENLVKNLLDEKSKILGNIKIWKKASSIEDVYVGLYRKLNHNAFIDNELLGYVDISLIPFNELRDFFVECLSKEIEKINEKLKFL